MFRYQQNSAATSNFQLLKGELGCCDDSGTPCKYALEYAADGTTITGIDFKDKDGNTVNAVFDTPIAEDDPLLIVKTITDVFAANGILDDGIKPNIIAFKESIGDPVVDYITIEIYGTVEVTNLVRASDATNAFVQYCTKTVACRYKFSVEEGADIDIIIDDVNLVAPQTIADLDATTAVDAPLLAEELNAAFLALYGVDYKRVKVDYNEVTAKYEVQVWLRDRSHRPYVTLEESDTPVDAVELAKCECITDFE